MSISQLFDNVYGTDRSAICLLHDILASENIVEKLVADVRAGSFNETKAKFLWQLIQVDPSYYEPVVVKLLGKRIKVSGPMFTNLLEAYPNLTNEFFSYMEKHSDFFKLTNTPSVLIKNIHKTKQKLSSDQCNLLEKNFRDRFYRMSVSFDLNEIRYFMLQWLIYNQSSVNFEYVCDILKQTKGVVSLNGSEEVSILRCLDRKIIVEVWRKSKNKTKKNCYAKHFLEIQKLVNLI